MVYLSIDASPTISSNLTTVDVNPIPIPEAVPAVIDTSPLDDLTSMYHQYLMTVENVRKKHGLHIECLKGLYDNETDVEIRSRLQRLLIRSLTLQMREEFLVAQEYFDPHVSVFTIKRYRTLPEKHQSWIPSVLLTNFLWIYIKMIRSYWSITSRQ